MKSLIRFLFCFVAVFSVSHLAQAQQLGVKVKTYPGADRKKIWLMATAGTTSTDTPSIGVLKRVALTSLTNDSFYINAGFSGRIYFFIDVKDTSQIPQQASALGLDTTFKVRYDWVEISYFGGPWDCVNLSSVDQFGIALSIKSYNASYAQMGSLGYRVSANQLISSLKKLAPKAVFQHKGKFIRVMSPVHATYAYPSYTPYYQMLAKQKDSIVLFDQYVGSKATYIINDSTSFNKVYPAKLFYFTTLLGNNDSIELKSHYSVANDTNFFHGRIKIRTKDFPAMLYLCEGPFRVYPYTGRDTSYVDMVGFNDPWSSVVRNLMAGFNIGYLGDTATLANGYHMDGNHSWDWNPYNGFKNKPNMKQVMNYNPYAKAIYDVSDSYGFAFTDFIAKPLLPLPGVASFTVTIQPDSMTNAAAYSPPFAQLKTDSVNPVNSDGTNLIVVLNMGTGLPDPCLSPVTFYGKKFTNGWNYTALDTAHLNTTSAGNITFTNVPYKKGLVNKYTYILEGKAFSFSLQMDSVSGHIVQASTDNPMIVTAISPDGNSVTISNIQFCVSPAYLHKKQ